MPGRPPDSLVLLLACTGKAGVEVGGGLTCADGSPALCQEGYCASGLEGRGRCCLTSSPFKKSTSLLVPEATSFRESAGNAPATTQRRGFWELCPQRVCLSV